ncbi:hypothetical protein CRUP_007960 [Coryphaenoides rupestris]|nr:hypothetical protein CRUP_007960 [Coryphaenoides rupestris]
MTAILDQKHYIEELNRNLSGTVGDLQAKMDSLEKTNGKLVEEVTLQDSQVELETYRQTRQGLDEMYTVELEREMELQVGLKQEMEVAMRLLEKDTHEKQDTLAALRLQLDQDCQREAERKQQEASQLEGRMSEMETAILQRSESQRTQSAQSDEAMRSELQRKVETLQKQLSDLDTLRLGLETELRGEKEQRQSLQRALQREQDNSSELRTQLQQLQGLHMEKTHLQQRCEQQEQALQEMGLHLSQSKLKMEDFKEVNKALKGHAWLKDDEATECKRCQKEFSISRRKLPLPSYPRPVRVCDICHSLLMQRSSTCSSSSS